MKTFKLLFLISLSILFASLSFAQNYKSHFKVDKHGKIENNGRLGTIDKDGVVKDNKGNVIGKIVATDGGSHLLDHLGKKIGELAADGTLSDKEGKTLYTVGTADKNGICKIIDSKGKEVGTVHQNYKQQGACAYHCLANKNHKHK